MLNQIYQKDIHYFFDRRREEIVLKKWIRKQEKSDRDIINKRLIRVTIGNYGDYKSVGNNILN